MYAWWSARVIERKRAVIVVAAVFLTFAAVWGTGVFGALVDGGFDDPANESSRATALLAKEVGRTDADLILVVDSADHTVADPAYRQDVQTALDQLPDGIVASTTTYWSSQAPTMVSTDKHATFALVTLTSATAIDDSAQIDAVRSSLTDEGYAVQIGGPAAINRDISSRVSADIGRAEAISMPILLVLLVVIFGTVVAASLPLLIGGVAILGAFTALRVLTYFTDVSIFAANLVTILGLGLAIDYGLLMVGRYREERAAGRSVEAATARTVQTAGRTVGVSALVVAVALSGLLLFPQTFLKSMGYGGIAAVLVAAVAAVGVLPAVLAVLGDRIEKGAVRRRRPVLVNDDQGFWFGLAHSVMRRPGRYLIAALALLAVLTVPFLGVKFGGIDERVLPASAEARQATDLLSKNFGVNPGDPIVTAVTTRDPISTPAGQSQLTAYVTSISGIDGATGAKVVAAEGTTARVDLSYRGESLDDTAKQVVAAVREAPRPDGVQRVLVGGPTAALVDRLDSIRSTLPWMALLVGLATFLLLFLAFGSIALPIKAILLNVLSLGASLGVVTWIFQGGHLSGLLGFTSTGFVEATQPILVVAIVFGLSMDYEVFLLSRIREQYDLSGDNTLAVATGLQRTGRIITSAAMLIIIVIAAFSASSITFIKLIGVAMLTAIVIDALVVRMIVVPAVMRLMGRANWWAPTSLRVLYTRFGIRDEAREPASVVPEPTRQRELLEI